MAAKKGWTIQRETWKELPKLITDNKWENTKAKLSSAILVPDSPGIYMFCASQELKGLKLQNPMYIGKSMNLKRRFRDHIQRNEKIRKLRSCFQDNLEFCFLKITSEIDTKSLGLLEQDMIDCFGPQLNDINSVTIAKPLRVTLGDPIKI